LVYIGLLEFGLSVKIARSEENEDNNTVAGEEKKIKKHYCKFIFELFLLVSTVK
jgi:hypothetical protein